MFNKLRDFENHISRGAVLFYLAVDLYCTIIIGGLGEAWRL
jgi:hypothetical protein